MNRECALVFIIAREKKICVMRAKEGEKSTNVCVILRKRIRKNRYCQIFSKKGIFPLSLHLFPI